MIDQEKWYEMTRRHKRERYEMVKSLAKDGFTQTEAAQILHVDLSCLNNYVQRNKIFWPVKLQGKRSSETHTKMLREFVQKRRAKND